MIESDCLNGGLGLLSSEGFAIIISKGGKTEGIQKIINSIESKAVSILLVTENKDSELIKLVTNKSSEWCCRDKTIGGNQTNKIETLKSRIDKASDDAIFLERIQLLNDFDKENPDIPINDKYVDALCYLLENLTVKIYPEDLIVGSIIEKEPTPEEESWFIEVSKGNNYSAAKLFSVDPLQTIEISDKDPRYAPSWFNSWGHLNIDWELLIEEGLVGIEKRLTVAGRGVSSFNKNSLKVIHAVKNFANRYGDEAEKLSNEETDSDREEELNKISAICKKVPYYTADNFWEALQSIWFINLILHYICGARDYALGRFDQYLKNHYSGSKFEKDLIKHLFLRTNEYIGYGVETFNVKRVLHVNSNQYVILGGMTLEGIDQANQLTYDVLEIIWELKMKQPVPILRYHENIEKNVLNLAEKIVLSGEIGYPTFFNEKQVKKAYKKLGINDDDLEEFGYVACNNPNIIACEDELREAWHNIPQYIELTLNEGRRFSDEKLIGVRTKDPSKIDSWSSFFTELLSQMMNGILLACERIKANDKEWAANKRFSLESLFVKDCIDKGSDIVDGGSRYRHMNHHLVGIATTANSLFAIKELVFTKKEFTLTEIRNILKNNYANQELLRERLVNRLEKFGNDLDSVDSIAVDVCNSFISIIDEINSSHRYGRTCYPEIFSLWWHRDFGKVTGATFDGRKAGEPLSENQSPVYGTDKNGPTALLNSLEKIPFERTPGGGLNIKLDKSLFKNEREIFECLLKGYLNGRGLQMQVDLLSNEELIDAMKNPEKHKDLLVRIVGYSAYFVTLSPNQQMEIINRTDGRI